MDKYNDSRPNMLETAMSLPTHGANDLHDLSWPKNTGGRIPLWVYSDRRVYERELERIFYGPHWSYIALEAEIPNVGDFKLTRVGERPVIVVRNTDNGVSVL